MESNCPYCGAPGAMREAVDGCCYVCGMVLPEASAGQATVEAVEVPAAAPEPAEATDTAMDATISLQPASPTAVIDDDGTEVPAIQLVQPRNLGPEYARRVTAAWQQTKSPFQNPRETLNSSSSKTGDPENLLIATRSLGSVDDKGQRADYELSEVIGEGNMGTVWSARQASLDREVAVKMPKRVAGGSTLGREQFISEVVVTGQLDHPNIVPIYDMGRDESGGLFYAMKRVEGRPWDECMHEEGRTRQENVEILMKVCDAIRFAHDRGVIHRDIKPQNIMVGKYGEVSVMDWGIALRLPAQGKSANVIKLSPAGTPAYMAPEMATANAADIGPHTDVYLLGAVLYEIITREPPHPPPADSHDRLVQQNACLLMAARNVITPATETGELIDIAYKAMATDISKRYQTVDEFQSAIREYFSHAESIALADHGHAHLAHALESRNGVYEDYARARFAFGEALQLWPENTRARNGLAEATMAYANRALKDGNYGLGISLLDPANEEHADLLKRLKAAKRKADRNRFVALASAAAAACFLMGGIAVSSYFYFNERKAKIAEIDARKDETDAKNAALAAKEEEKKAKEEALQAQKDAEEARDAERFAKEEESKAKDEQMRLKDEAVALATSEAAAKQRALQASYNSEIGVAAGHVERNAFKLAQEILGKQAENEVQSELRGWEWGHLWYQAAQEPSIERFTLGRLTRVESVAYSKDKQWIASGTDKGEIAVWRTNSQEKSRIAEEHGAPISGVAISPNNSLLATVGGKQLRLWRLPAAAADNKLIEVATSPYKGDDESATLLSVAFSQKGDRIVTSTSDSKMQIWLVERPAEPIVNRNADKAGPVYLARFSQDGRDQIVTAGHDESVRIWNSDGTQVSRLYGHRGPVYAADFSPDGNFVISGGRDRRLLVWDLTSGGGAGNSPKKTIEARLIPIAEESVQNTDRYQQLGEHSAAIRAISFSQEGNFVFSASDDNTVRIWDNRQGLANIGANPDRLEKTLRGHGGWVRSCVAAADNEHVLSGSYDGQVFLWNWSKYAFPRVLSEESRPRYTSSAASLDARWIATATESGEVTIWDMKDLQNLDPKTLREGHDWQATTAAYFNDGSRLLTSGGDNATVVWDSRLGSQLFRLGGWNTRGGTGWRGVGAVSQNGRIIATGSDDGDDGDEHAVLAKLWDAESGRLVAPLRIPNRNKQLRPEATAIAFAPNDGTLFIGDQNGRCYVFTMNNQYPYWWFNGHSKKVSAARFLSNGRLLTASSDGTVVKWNVAQETASPPREMMLRHRERVLAMDVSSDERLLITATATDTKYEDTALRLWDLSIGTVEPTDEALRTLPKTALGSNEVRSVAFHPTRPHALVTLFDPNRTSLAYDVGIWNWDGAGSVWPVFSRLADTSMAMYAPGREGTILTVGGRGARLRLASQRNGAVQMSYRSPARLQSVAFSPDSRLLAAAGDEEGSIKLWRLDDATGQWVADRKLMGQHQGAVRSVVFHPADENKMLTAGADGRAMLWQREGDDWQVVHMFGEGQTAPLNQAIFSPKAEDGSVKVLTASHDGKVRVWSESGDLIRDDISHNAPVQCVAMSNDGAWIVAGTGNLAVVWNARESKNTADATLSGHFAEVTSLAFSADGRLITASKDHNVKLWDPKPWGTSASDREQTHVGELLTLSEHKDAVTSICLFPKAVYPSIVTAGLDGQAILWPSMDWRAAPVQALGRR